MKTVLVLVLVLALSLASGQEIIEGTAGEGNSASQRTEREETTEKIAPQVYTYRTPTVGNVYPSGVYPGTYNPSYTPGTYNPSYTPGTYNPSYTPGTYNPTYNPSYTPGSYYPTVGARGGVYPVSGADSRQAFTARRASSLTQQGSRVILREPVTQSGSGWNSARGEFVAASTGFYFFTFSAMSDRSSHFRMTLRHNGVEVVSAYGDAAGYQMGSQSCVLRLNSGDRVYLQLDEGRLYDVTSARAYTVFSGFRIF